MIDTSSPLIVEFLKDHQQFSRLIFEIHRLLKEGKTNEARARAIELDSLAGGHVEYEETELYPRLLQLGNKTTTESVLVDEHHGLLHGLRTLIENQNLDDEQLHQIIESFAAGLTHAEHCGTLISLMSKLDERDQSTSLAELYRLRQLGRKWTEMDVD